MRFRVQSFKVYKEQHVQRPGAGTKLCMFMGQKKGQWDERVKRGTRERWSHANKNSVGHTELSWGLNGLIHAQAVQGKS